MKKQKNKKAQIGTLFANFVMTIIIVFVLAGFIISSSAIKSRYNTDVNIHKLITLDMYSNQLKNYRDYTAKNPKETINCDEISIYELNDGQGSVFFSQKDGKLVVRQHDSIDWEPFEWNGVNGKYQLSGDLDNEVLFFSKNSDYYIIEDLFRSLYSEYSTKTQKNIIEQINILKSSNLIGGVGYDC